MQYQPMSYESHLARGYCCYESRGQHSRCIHCPWKPTTIIPPFVTDKRIEAALLSGETVTIESDRISLVPQVKIQNVTINYKPYQKK